MPSVEMLEPVANQSGFIAEVDGGAGFKGPTWDGGTTLDPEELLATLRDVALIADEYDDN